MVEQAEAELVEAARAGDGAAWGVLLSRHDERLRRVVTFRLDQRLRGRVDAADVVQEAYAEAAAHRERFFAHGALPLFVWLRGVVSNKLLELHRHHLGTRLRDAGRDVAMDHPMGGGPVDATSEAMVALLTGGLTGPATRAARSEVGRRLHDALSGMDAADREVLALRHFEQLSNAEAAAVLNIQERAAAKRYLRALKRLKDALAEMPGGLTEFAL